jgi:hypothetical protein
MPIIIATSAPALTFSYRRELRQFLHVDAMQQSRCGHSLDPAPQPLRVPLRVDFDPAWLTVAFGRHRERGPGTGCQVRFDQDLPGRRFRDLGAHLARHPE